MGIKKTRQKMGTYYEHIDCKAVMLALHEYSDGECKFKDNDTS